MYVFFSSVCLWLRLWGLSEIHMPLLDSPVPWPIFRLNPRLVALHNGYVLCISNTGGNTWTQWIANTFIKLSSYQDRHNFSLTVLLKEPILILCISSDRHIKLKKIDPSTNRIGGVMVSVLASRAIDRGFELRSGQAKDYIKLVSVASALRTQH
jgi:hypothetical protein